MHGEQARHCLRLEARAIEALISRINGEFERAVEMILSCRGRVVVTGIGKSGLIGRKVSATLASTGTPAITASESTKPNPSCSEGRHTRSNAKSKREACG